jgi:F-type H+-transporting ATPase subunit delta
VTGSAVARSYAEALFSLGEKHNRHDSFSASLAAFNGALATSPQLRAFLASPKIDAHAKKTSLRNALAGKADPIFLNFLSVLIDKRRQRLMPAIGDEYNALLDERLGRLNVQVTLARQPDATGERELAEKLSRTLGRTVVPHITVNKEILGGIIVRFGDRVLDGSLRRKMLSMRRRLLDAGLPTQNANR